MITDVITAIHYQMPYLQFDQFQHFEICQNFIHTTRKPNGFISICGNLNTITANEIFNPKANFTLLSDFYWNQKLVNFGLNLRFICKIQQSEFRNPTESKIDHRGRGC